MAARYRRRLHCSIYDQLRRHEIQARTGSAQSIRWRQWLVWTWGGKIWPSIRKGLTNSRPIAYKSAKGFAYATDLHVANFLECMRTRKKTTAPIALGFQSTLVVQMANLSLQHGCQIRWNPVSGKVEF